MWKFILVVSVIFWSRAFVEAQQSNFGDAVRDEMRGTLWACKAIKDRPSAVDCLKKQKKPPQTCTFVGSGKGSIAYCEPQQSIYDSKSQQNSIGKHNQDLLWACKAVEDHPHTHECIKKQQKPPHTCTFVGTKKGSIFYCEPHFQ